MLRVSAKIFCVRLRDLLDFVTGDQKAAFAAVGANASDVTMLRDFHNGTWFTTQHGMPKDGGQVLATTIGALQSCARGAVVFNATYESALRDIQKLLRGAKITTHLSYDLDAPPWEIKAPHGTTPVGKPRCSVEVAGIDFVDDKLLLFKIQLAIRGHE